MNERNDFVLWPYPYYYGTIVGYFRTTRDKEIARAYLNTQRIKISGGLNNPEGITYPTDFELIEHKGILILICNCGFVKAHWRNTPQYEITINYALDEYASQVSQLLYQSNLYAFNYA